MSRGSTEQKVKKLERTAEGMWTIDDNTVICRLFTCLKIPEKNTSTESRRFSSSIQTTSKLIRTCGSCRDILAASISVTLNHVLMMLPLSLRSEFRKL